ncbi:low molecular weight protein-tyrosine-phosphatase [Paraburkholderia phosphatilytica]|uniref:low molecular weight protein-tyrosine-phosphatase n=1 Tax=Paraburkholderia phosphatilytica TaxID=2282883 RepID=UPI000E4BDFAA|nr:low molecular weight protein-tyrosine-phosphatase [Paraburkholderia phosphatilytica]
MKSIAICFVCLGNICRSPTAEGVMRDQVAAAKLGNRIEIDSAGTGGWHIGAADFERFDLLIAMDDANVAALTRICPPAHRDKIRLLMEFDPQADAREVVDPYFGDDGGFEAVLDQCEAACRGLLAGLRGQLAN